MPVLVLGGADNDEVGGSRSDGSAPRKSPAPKGKIQARHAVRDAPTEKALTDLPRDGEQREPFYGLTVGSKAEYYV